MTLHVVLMGFFSQTQKQSQARSLETGSRFCHGHTRPKRNALWFQGDARVGLMCGVGPLQTYFRGRHRRRMTPPHPPPPLQTRHRKNAAESVQLKASWLKSRSVVVQEQHVTLYHGLICLVFPWLIIWSKRASQIPRAHVDVCERPVPSHQQSKDIHLHLKWWCQKTLKFKEL